MLAKLPCLVIPRPIAAGDDTKRFLIAAVCDLLIIEWLKARFCFANTYKKGLVRLQKQKGNAMWKVVHTCKSCNSYFIVEAVIAILYKNTVKINKPIYEVTG